MISTPCDVWSGALNNRGYGVRKVGGRKGRTVLVHRLTWEEAHGPIPDGLFVLHHCDNPPCRNIEHLFLGTHADNMADMRAKGRRSYTHGEDHERAKLTWSQVSEIRQLFAAGGTTRYRLGKMFGVDHSVIDQIIKGLIWRDEFNPQHSVRATVS